MSDQNQWRSYCLVITAISLNLATIYALINPTVANRPVTNFQFPQQIKLPSAKAISANDAPKVIKSSSSSAEIIETRQKYKYTQENLPISLEISYLVNTRGDVASYIQTYTKIATEAITSEKTAQIKQVGYHTLLSDGDRAYLSSCISPRSLSNVTQKQFSQYRYQNDLNLQIGWQWLLGKASIRDRRCLWVHLSTPLVSDSQTAYETLEATWQELYQWWLPNFPAL
jgi:cyanosortase A-associated protein